MVGTGRLALPPEPFGMGAAPSFHMVVVLLNHHAEFDTGFAITMVAELMHADHFRLAGILSEGAAGE